LVPIYRAITAVLFLLVTLYASAPCVAQYHGPTSCTELDVTPNVHFYQATDGMQVMALEYRNIGVRACFLSAFAAKIGTNPRS